MGRTVDVHSGTRGPTEAQGLGPVRAGLANGSMERGRTEREARGTGKAPTWGAILLPDQVDVVTPPLGGGEDVVAWEVVGSVTVEGRAWRGSVVGIRVVRRRYM